LAIEAIHPLVVDLPSFALEQHVETAITIAHPGSGKVTQRICRTIWSCAVL
jgi:hypothetical protein